MGYVPPNPNGQATSANSAPVVVASDQSNLPTNVKQINGTTVDTNSGSKSAGTQRVVLATDQPTVPVGGDVAAAATDSGNPVKTGGVAKTTNPTAVTDGQRVNALFSKTGKQVVVGSLRELKGRQVTTITSSTGETTIVTAGGAGVFNDLYGLVLTNTSGTATEVTVRDATAGGTVSSFMVPASDSRGFMLPESGAWPQTTAASAWTATCATSVASLKVTALYVQNV